MLRDELDRQIVAYLEADGRATFDAIGARVGLSAPAVKRRVDRLRRDRVLLRFTAVVDPVARGTTTEAFVEVHCRGHTSPSEILDVVEDHPEVVAAYTVSGDADALLRLRTADIGELERVLERIRADDRIERSKSIIVLSRLLERSVGVMGAET
ncbi:MAG: Lrp/AsnC family transcriptional regulator [Acidimicrobiia bacterium]